MDNTRKMNIRIITTILGSLPDNTLVFSDKLPLTMSSKDGDKFEGNFDRMALECDDNGNCTVWFDELGEKVLTIPIPLMILMIVKSKRS